MNDTTPAAADMIALAALLVEMRETDRVARMFAATIPQLALVTGGPVLPLGAIGRRAAAIVNAR